MKTEIRQFQPEDLNAVADLIARVLPDAQPHNNPRDSLQRKIDHDATGFVAIQASRICGFVMTGYDGHRGWVYQLAVDPDLRRQGIGRRLVTVAVESLRSLGCPKINLQVRADNQEVISFYESLGFSVEDRVSMGLVTG